MESNILVIGVGNVLLKDDGLGPQIVHEMEEEYHNPSVTFLDGGTLGLDLLGYLEGYEFLIIVDAIDIKEAPGSLFTWQGQTLSGISNQVSFHQVGLKELLDAARLMGLDLEVTVIGIQAEELTWGIGLSQSVQKAVPLLKNALVHQIREYGIKKRRA